jgi:hypothetical protein
MADEDRRPDPVKQLLAARPLERVRGGRVGDHRALARHELINSGIVTATAARPLGVQVRGRMGCGTLGPRGE